MRTWLIVLVACASAFAQAGAVPDLGPDPTAKPQTQPGRPATAPAGRGAAPAAPSGAGRSGRGAPAPAAAALPNPRDLKYPPLRTVQIPGLVTSTLANGLKVALLEDHELPVINGMALVRTGNLLDPPGKIGLAAMSGAMLRAGGTTAKSPEQMDNLLEGLAASVDSATEESYARIAFGAVKEEEEAILGLFKEVLTQPAFRQEKIDLLRSQMRTAIAKRNDDPATIAHRELASVIYGKDSPFGWIGQYSTVDSIKRADIRSFYERYFVPANVTLGIWGDFDAARMKAAIEKLFGDWNPPRQPAPEFPTVKDVPAPGIYLAAKQDLTEAYFAVGQLGARANDKDVAPMQIAAAILGNGPRGRLAAKARAKTGAPHDIRVTWQPGYDRPGLLEIAGSTRGVNAIDVLKVIQAEIDRIRTTEVAEEELIAARDAVLNSLVFANDTKVKLLTRQLALDYFGYPKDYMAQHQKALQAVTRADVLRVAKERIKPENLVIVVVTNPQLLGEPLERLGPTVNKIDLTIPEPRADTVPATEISLAEGKQILQRAQAAAGGAEKLGAIKDYTEIASYQIDSAIPNIGGRKVTETDRWIAPTYFRQDSVLPAGRVAAYTDGKIGWISTPQGWGGLAGAQQKQVLGDLFRCWFRLLLSDRIEGRTVNAIDSNSVEITDSTGQEAKVEFDAETGLPRRVTYDTPQAVGAPLYTEDVFEDYREVDGIKLPFKITINQSGRKFADTTVSEYKLNSGLKVTDLSRRPL